MGGVDAKRASTLAGGVTLCALVAFILFIVSVAAPAKSVSWKNEGPINLYQICSSSSNDCLSLSSSLLPYPYDGMNLIGKVSLALGSVACALSACATAVLAIATFKLFGAARQSEVTAATVNGPRQWLTAGVVFGALSAASGIGAFASFSLLFVGPKSQWGNYGPGYALCVAASVLSVIVGAVSFATSRQLFDLPPRTMTFNQSNVELVASADYYQPATSAAVGVAAPAPTAAAPAPWTPVQQPVVAVPTQPGQPPQFYAPQPSGAQAYAPAPVTNIYQPKPSGAQAYAGPPQQFYQPAPSGAQGYAAYPQQMYGQPHQMYVQQVPYGAPQGGHQAAPAPAPSAAPAPPPAE